MMVNPKKSSLRGRLATLFRLNIRQYGIFLLLVPIWPTALLFTPHASLATTGHTGRACEVLLDFDFSDELSGHLDNILNTSRYDRRHLKTRLEKGMVEEVKDIVKKGYLSLDMRKFGLEYVSIAKYLEDTITEEEMKQEIITKSMQYVKRQETWNKKYLPIATIVKI